MLIGIAYNQPQPLHQRGIKEKKSEEGVLEEVSDVKIALEKIGHLVKLIPLKNDINAFIRELKSFTPNCIFNLCEGAYGFSHYEMTMPSLFELLRIPYTGSPSITLGNCLNKATTNYILLGAGLSVPNFEVISNIGEIPKINSFPLIVKPVQEDASIGIYKENVVFDKKMLLDKIKYTITTYSQPALIERFIDGREFSVSLIGNYNPEVLSISEIDFSKTHQVPRILTYNGKWNEKSNEWIRTPVICPAKISKIFKNKLERISKIVYEVMGCIGYARIDIRSNEFDKPYIIDVNPNPDISKKAGFANSARKSGLDYIQLIKKIVDLAVDANINSCKSKSVVSIRKISENDIPRIINLLDSTGVFRRKELDVALEVINTYIRNPEEKYYLPYVADYGVNDGIGYICFGPTPLTDSTYDIYWLAVDNRFQNFGIGRQLLRFAEKCIKDLAGKKVIIETSSKNEYITARSLYKNSGYKEVAKILNYYSDGDDKIIFEKELISARD